MLFVEHVGIAYYKSLCVADWCMGVFKPVVVFDILDIVSLLGVTYKNLRNEIFSIFAYIIWYLVFTNQYLLIQLCCVWIFERKVATDEGK